MHGRPTAPGENVNPNWRETDIDDKPDHLPSGTSVSSTRQAAYESASRTSSFSR
jgi:hypothetical protein